LGVKKAVCHLAHRLMGGLLKWWVLAAVAPKDKAFQGVVFWQAKLVKGICGAFVAIFGSLPKLTGIDTAWKHGFVFLRLVTENGIFLPFHNFRA
jgi:hypothetical protein